MYIKCVSKEVQVNIWAFIDIHKDLFYYSVLDYCMGEICYHIVQ